MAIVLFLLMFRIDNDTTIVDTFDLIEINHYHNEWGVPRWTQVILWDWHRLDGKFHVEKWIMIKDAYQKTEEGEKKWEKMRREIESSIKNLDRKREWIRASEYPGDFVKNRFYPMKNWTTGYYEIRYRDNDRDRLIMCKIFRETHTQYDPEREDRDEHPVGIRRGLSLPRSDSIESVIEQLSHP
jgi:hypothetical protein